MDNNNQEKKNMIRGYIATKQFNGPFWGNGGQKSKKPQFIPHLRVFLIKRVESSYGNFFHYDNLFFCWIQ